MNPRDNLGLVLDLEGAALRPDRLDAWVDAATAAGIRSFWALDNISSGLPDPLLALARVAGRAPGVEVGTSILIGPLHAPDVLARSLATLDCLTGGRLVVGLGVGNRPGDYEAARTSFTTRGARMEELLLRLQQLWRDPESRVGPAPVTPGGPPLLLAGHQPRSIDRAARLANGFVGGANRGPAFALEIMTLVRERLAAHGRDETSFRFVVNVFTAFGRDPASAFERARAGIEARGVPDPTPDIAAVGPPEAVQETIAQLHDGGFDQVNLVLASNDADQLDALASMDHG